MFDFDILARNEDGKLEDVDGILYNPNTINSNVVGNSVQVRDLSRAPAPFKIENIYDHPNIMNESTRGLKRYEAGRNKEGKFAYSAEEVIDQLRGFIEVPAAEWRYIPIGTQVRWLLKTGEWRAGGFVCKILNKCGDDMMIISNKYQMSGRGSYVYPVVFNKVARVFRYKNPEIEQLEMRLLALEEKCARYEKILSGGGFNS